MLRNIIKLFSLALVVALWVPQGLAQEQQQGEDQTEAQDDDDRRVRRLSDSLATDPGAEWVPTLDSGDRQVSFQRKLQAGERALESGKLTRPEGDNALGYFRDALAVSPDHPNALDGISRVAEAVMAQARAAFQNGDRSAAMALIAELRGFFPDQPGLDALEADVSRRAELQALAETADGQLGSGRLIAPPGDNALESYRAVLAIDPTASAGLEGIRRVEAALISRAQGAAQNEDFPAAAEFVQQARLVGAETGEVERALDAIQRQRQSAWAAHAAAIRSDIEADRLERAQQALSSLAGKGYDDAELSALYDALEESRILRTFEPGTAFSDGDSAPQMVVIPRGEYLMGSPDDEAGRSDNEGPQRAIRIRRPFALSKGEVTVAQFKAFADATGYTGDAEQNGQSTIYDVDSGTLTDRRRTTWKNDFQGDRARDDHPAVHVSWNDAQAYVAWLSEQTGQRYRLPSEAEFEYALRARTTSRYWWGDGSPDGKVENLTGDRDKIGGRWEWPQPFERYSDGHWGPAPEDRFAPNPFGLHNMGGNAMEWVADCYTADLSELPGDGSAMQVSGCTTHGIRGGSWANPPNLSRSASRSSARASRTSCLIGFRVARDL